MLRMSSSSSGRFIRDWVEEHGGDIGDKMDCFTAKGLLLTHYCISSEKKRRNQSIDFQQNPQSLAQFILH